MDGILTVIFVSINQNMYAIFQVKTKSRCKIREVEIFKISVR